MIQLPYEILFEDQDLLVINKPAGINSVMQKGGGPSVAEELLKTYPDLKFAAKKIEDAGLLHRLDRETSGVLLIAKNREAWVVFSEALNAEGCTKSYTALCEGEMREEVLVETFLGSPNRGAKKIRVYIKKPSSKARAQPASTLFSPLSYDKARGVTLVRAKIQRGKRHQIRAHAAWIEHPLVGDELYGSTMTLAKYLGSTAPKFFLHAERVELVHPLTKEKIEILAPLPGYAAKIGLSLMRANQPDSD